MTRKNSSLFSVIEADRDCNPGVSVSKTKGKRKLKNLECSINFALYFRPCIFFGFLYGCGFFWAVWVGSSLGSRVCFRAFGWVT
jgi:hypothetical protein